MRKYIVFTVLTMVLFLSACGKNAYELDEELTVSFNGYDEYGTAEVSIDSDLLSENLRKLTGIKTEEDASAFNQLMDSIAVEVTPNENLENGDKVDLELSYDEENPHKFKLSLKNTQYEVVDLKPIVTLSQDDIFSDITISYEGVSPFLRIWISASGEISSLFEYKTDAKYLANNDEFELKAEPIKDLLSRGYKVDDTDLSYKESVSDQPQLVESWDELTKEDQEYVLEEIDKVVKDEFDRPLHSSFFSILKKGEYEAPGVLVERRGETIEVGNYFLFIDEKAYKASEDPMLNSIRIVYQKELGFGTSYDGNEYSDKTINVYGVIGANNLILDEDGNLLREELKTRQFGKTDMDLETVEQNGIYPNQDEYHIDKFK